MTKISALASLAFAKPDDLLAVVDVHDTSMAASGTDKNITVSSLLGLAPSGDTSGATDYANINALKNLGGIVTLQAGQFHLGTNTVTFNQNMNMTGAGSTLTLIDYTGTSQAIVITISGTFTGGQYAGKFGGFYLSGYSAGSSAVGVQLGDLQGAQVNDLAIYGFSGIGMHVLNTTGDWAEQSNIQARIVQCGTAGSNGTGAVVFDSSSCDYGNYDFTIVTSNGTHCMVLQNGAQLQGAKIRMRGNCYGAASNTAAVIAVDPGNTSGTSYILNTEFDVAMETAGSNTGHYLVLMGSANTTSQFFGTGVLNLSSVGPASQGISNASFLPFGFTGIMGDRKQGCIVSYGYEYTISTDGTDNSNNAIAFRPYQGWFGIYDNTSSTYFGVSTQLPSPTGTSTLGGYYYGLGIGGSSNNAGHPIFGVLTSTQSGQGTGSTAFTILDTNEVETYNNILDNGSGAQTIHGLASHNGGTDTSGTATASSPSFTSGTAKQLSTSQDVILYIAIQTAAALAVAIGPTSTPATTVMPSQTYALGLTTIRVPKGWYVKITGTIADLTITQVTC